MKKNNCKLFIWPTIVTLAISGFFLLYSNRTEIHLFVNSYHTPWADFLFKYITHLGDGLIFTLALPFLIFKDLRSFFIVGVSGLFVLIVSGIMKNVIFKGLPRPTEFFKDHFDLYLVPGVELHSINSFPSGHTMAAFACYFAICYLLNKKLWSVMLFILAVLVAYSRMYLSQHFLIDITMGAILGLIVAMISIRLINSWNWNKLDESLISLIKKNA